MMDYRMLLLILLIEADIRLAPAAMAFLFRHAMYELIENATAAITMMVDVAITASPIVKSKSETLNRDLSNHGLLVWWHS